MEQASGRSCGGCTACCFTHEIVALKKPLATACPECTVGVGCKIYGTHPLECEKYKCFWLMTNAPEDWRPDKLGVIMDIWPGKTPILRLWEVEPGKMNQPKIQEFIEHLKSQKRVVIVRRRNLKGGFDDETLVPFEEDDPALQDLIKSIEADNKAFEESRA